MPQTTAPADGASPPAPTTVDAAGESRGRPGRRTVEDRRQAVLDLLAGKATIDQLARRYGVLPETVTGWRDDAITGIEEALRRGTGKTGLELELERENEVLRQVATDAQIQVALLQRQMGITARPYRPARSRR